MNKAELIAAVAEKTEFTKKDAEAAVNAVVSSVEDALKNGEKVQLIGFGTFEVRNRKARQGRNPRKTGQGPSRHASALVRRAVCRLNPDQTGCCARSG